MAPLIIDGETLGEIHRKYNKIVNETDETKETEITDLNFDDSDIDNLFKIDIASKNRNVDFILKVLKCHDMLYVSRAIKKNTWLVTEEQYAHIINPDHLFNVLQQQITMKAFNKLVLHIRLNLKDEKRVEEFYNYYKDSDLKTAMKWLPRCSNAFIEEVLKKHANEREISKDLIKRLCEKSISFLEIYNRHNHQYNKREALFQVMFIMNTDVDKYLDIIEAADSPYMPYFKPKYTKILMTKCRERVMRNLERYAISLDLPTFAKYLSQEEAKDFIMKNVNNRLLCGSWGGNNMVKYFLSRLPSEDRFEFIKKMFIDKEYKKDVCDVLPYRYDQMNCAIQSNPNSRENIYSWYEYAPFNTAFTDLKKLIRTESNPSERVAILSVILITAGRNMENIHSLLKYYRENHINEPYKFKSEFVNKLLFKTIPYKFDKKTWHYLKDIYTSMEVYSETDKFGQQYVVTVLLHCIINDEEIPKIIEDKFSFSTLDEHKDNLTKEEKVKVFNYLFNYLNPKIQNVEMNSQEQFREAFGYIEFMIHLINDWDRHLKDYPLMLEKLKQLIAVRDENKEWYKDIAILYILPNSWKKLLFKESLLLSPQVATVLNILKHDPKLVEEYRARIIEILKNNTNLDPFFRKLRIYWPHSLAKSYKDMLMNNLKQNYTHKPFMTGLLTLMPHKEVTEIIKEYVPSEFKIDWSQHDAVQLNIRKLLGMFLHIARPQPSLDMALLYAKGDYLQYALSSLNAILYNMSSADVENNLVKLINAPVSLQKHGIRAAILKLHHDDLMQILSDIWKKNKNSSIRAGIFVQTFKMLCEERNEDTIKIKWELLKMFIKNLTAEEDKKIYTCLSKFKDIPMSVRGDFWMKGYAFLSSLPKKANCESLVDHMIFNMIDIMVQLDDNFVSTIFLNSFKKFFFIQYYSHAPLVACFLLSAKTEEAQMSRYKKLLLPILEYATTEWDKNPVYIYHIRCNTYEIIKNLSYNFDMVLRNKLVFPTKMFEEILKFLQKKLPETENYILITVQKMALRYVNILEEVVKEEQKKGFVSVSDEYGLFKELREKAVHKFSELCLQHLKEDVTKYFPSIYILFSNSLNSIFQYYKYTNMEILETFKGFISDKDFVEGHLLVLVSLPFCLNDDEFALRDKILQAIKDNPNEEIKMNFWFHTTTNPNFMLYMKTM
ncbi:uncharacterized protein LOC116777173 [Danaus plexippus]|uniref:Uncharacterized protein n=1 Tax=Danaus plexippus plexippus TaxID=278856 RepID=A0A212FMH6_DANPL|nr:uncharacterized protein LOC116777173 [Danaus plexippus]OWR54952.1 hypothetical protein KGM_207032 [Danaus plexippus plexippus]